MHLFGCADDRINRARLYAQRATDAGALGYDRDRLGFGCGGVAAERFDIHAEQVGQFLDACLATRRAAVDVCLSGGDRRCIGFAAGIAALPTLGLRQDGIDLVHQRITLGAKFDRGVSQHRAEHDRDSRHDQ